MNTYRPDYLARPTRALIVGCTVLALLWSSWGYALQEATAFTKAKRYDLSGRVTGVIYPRADSTEWFPAERHTYNSKGLLVTVEYGALATWQNESVEPAEWEGFDPTHRERYTYDQYGRKVSESRATTGGTRKTLTEFSYNDRNQVKCKKVTMGQSPHPSPNSACTASSNGTYGPDRVTEYVYNEDNHEIWKEFRAVGTDLEQLYAEYTYDGLLLKTSTDANGNLTEYDYDNYGRMTHWYFPDKTAAGDSSSTDYEHYKYDDNGNRRYVRKRDESVIQYTHDNLNQMIKKDISGTTTEDVHYRYDLRGLQKSARFGDSADDPGVTTEYTGFGEIEKETTSMGSVTYSMEYEYDANGNRESIQYPDENSFTYEYDGRDNLSELKRGTSVLISYGYDDYGRPETLSTAGNATTTLGYDSISRIDEIENNFGGAGSDLTIGFAYNPASQLVEQNLSNSRFHHQGQAGQTGSYDVNGLNQYTSIENRAIEYDDNGNFESDEVNDYSYDRENRLTHVAGTHNARLYYDPKGRLYKLDSHDTGENTYFLYSGDSLVAEYRDGQMIQRYVHGGGRLAPLISYDGAAIGTTNQRFLHTNHQGSVIAQTDHRGIATHINTYDEYGVPGEENEGRFSYTGQMYLPEIGLYHYRARMYNPFIGRFMQTDPVGYEDQMNLYTYVHNDPLNYTDPTGKVAQVCAIPTGPMQACAAAATKVGGWIAAAIGAIWVASEATDDSSDLPEDLVGVQDDKAGRQGNRHNSGPLSPEHGGTGDAESDFDVLNPSGNSEETDDGTRVGESGVRLRPGTDKKGPRIDVPASGDKPHETLHYPPKEKEPK